MTRGLRDYAASDAEGLDMIAWAPLAEPLAALFLAAFVRLTQ